MQTCSAKGGCFQPFSGFQNMIKKALRRNALAAHLGSMVIEESNLILMARSHLALDPYLELIMLQV